MAWSITCHGARECDSVLGGEDSERFSQRSPAHVELPGKFCLRRKHVTALEVSGQYGGSDCLLDLLAGTQDCLSEWFSSDFGVNGHPSVLPAALRFMLDVVCPASSAPRDTHEGPSCRVLLSSRSHRVDARVGLDLDE